MTHFLASAAVLAGCLASALGWGRQVARVAHPAAARSLPAAYQAALGVLAWIALGGVLNALHLAYLPALDAIAGAGLALFAGHLAASLRARGAWPPRRAAAAAGAWLGALGPRRVAGALPAMGVWAATGYLLATLLPTGVFNHHDDLQKYFVPPLRMLGTGTVGGDPFDTVGLFHLGPQSFLQAFVAGHFPLVYLNAFDAVFCFLLAGLLVDAAGRRAGTHPAMRMLAVLAFLAINPQLVNISPAYSASMMIAALVIAGALLREALGAGSGAALRAAVPVGAFAAALMALKATYVPFAALFLILLFPLLLLTGAGLRRTGAALAAGAAGAAGVLVPWAIGSGKDYVGVLVQFADRAGRTAARQVAAAPGPGTRPEAMRDIGDLFSDQPIYFGHTLMDYGLLALFLAALGLALTAYLARGREARSLGHAGAALAATLATVAYYLSIPWIFPLVQGVRYLSPILVVVLPIAALAVDLPGGPAGVGGMGGRAALARRGAVGAGLLMVLALFAVPLYARALESYRIGSLVSYRVGTVNLRYHTYAFSGVARHAARDAQAHTRPGAAILTWIATPFHLDFARNRVLTIPDPDFSRTWAGIPFDAGAEGLRTYLLERGVRYVMWDYAGPGMRSDAELKRDLEIPGYAYRGRFTLQFKGLLRELARAERVVHDDGFIRVIDLEPPPE